MVWVWAGRFMRRELHTKQGDVFGRQGLFHPILSRKLMQRGKIEYQDQKNRIGWRALRGCFFFSPNNGQSLECFFPKDHKNNTYFLKRQEIGDGYNHTGPKRGQQQEDQKESDRKNHQNPYMDFKCIKNVLVKMKL